MLFRPVQQEAAFFGLVLIAVPVIFVGIGVIIAWRSRKEGIRSLVPKFLGIVLGGIPIAYAFGAMMVSTAYNYPGSFLAQGFALGVGMLIIAIGNAISERFQDPDKKRINQLKGSHWIILNTLPAAGIGYLLIQIKFMPVFVPVMLMAVAACQWFPLKKVLPVSLWWLLSALFASLGYFTNLAGNLAIGFYTGGILMAAFQYFLLRKHNPQGGLFFAMATLFCWWLFGSFFYYVLGAAVSDRTSRLFVPMELRVLSYYGLVITWSSVLVGLIAARFIKPADTTPTLSA